MIKVSAINSNPRYVVAEMTTSIIPRENEYIDFDGYGTFRVIKVIHKMYTKGNTVELIVSKYND